MLFDEIISDDNLKILGVDLFFEYSFGGDASAVVSEKQKNIAFFARAMREHVAWENFPDEARKGFQAKIEKMYNNPFALTQEQLMKELNDAISHLPDKHAVVCSRKFFGYPPKGGNVGKNVIYSDKVDWVAKKDSVWAVGHAKDGSMVVSIADCGIPKAHLAESWADFKQAFDTLYQEKPSKIVLDVRGNMGGEDWPLDYIARKTYGNDLNAIQTAQIRDTKLAMHFLSKHGMFKYSDKKLDVQSMRFSGEKQVFMDERETYFNFNSQKGFNGQIDILTDRCVSSAAESAHNLFFHHPKARFIGEHTNGMQQYQQSNIVMPCGLMMRVGVIQRDYYDEKGTIEVSGHEVDIGTTGEDAFDVALVNTDMSKSDKRQSYLSKLTANRKHIAQKADYMEQKQKSFDAGYIIEAIRQTHKRNFLLCENCPPPTEAPNIPKQSSAENQSSLMFKMLQKSK